MSSWHSYPKIYNVGHAALTDFLTEDIASVEEKVDGSQFSFGIFGNEIKIRSKGVEMSVDAPEKMFNKAVEWVKNNSQKLHEGWTYRAEYLQKPKHNTLAYERTPECHLIIFDINSGEESYLRYEDKKIEANRIGLECVPLLWQGKGNRLTAANLKELLDNNSVLGGQKIEGVVIKDYTKFGKDKKVLMGKHVSEAFKEIHSGDWKERNPGRADIIQLLINKYKTPARWDKSIQHLKEKGQLENSPRDIGKLIKEAQKDMLSECQEDIKNELFNHFRNDIIRGTVGGLPEYYKNKLLESQFKNE